MSAHTVTAGDIDKRDPMTWPAAIVKHHAAALSEDEQKALEDSILQAMLDYAELLRLELS